MTLALIVCAGLISLLQGDQDLDEPEHRQLESEEAVLNRPDGLSGLLFSDKKILMTEDGWFGLVKDDESGIWYAYVPAEMKGQLYAFFNSDRGLDIEGEGVSESFESGDALPAFAEDEQYTFSLPAFEDKEAESGTVVFLYTENVPSMYIDTESGSMEAVDSDKKHQTEEEAAYRIYQTDGTPDSSGMCAIKGRGNSTWSQAKKPYNLKLRSDNSLLGMDKCSKLSLISNYYWDSSLRHLKAIVLAHLRGVPVVGNKRQGQQGQRRSGPGCHGHR
jgi:hypothetical protein